MLTLAVSYDMVPILYFRSLSMDVEDVSFFLERGTPFGRMGRNELGLCREVWKIGWSKVGPSILIR